MSAHIEAPRCSQGIRRPGSPAAGADPRPCHRAARDRGLHDGRAYPGLLLNVMMQAATYAIAVMGLVVVLGYCGQISIAQAAFFGIGAYGVALGTVDCRPAILRRDASRRDRRGRCPG